VGRFTLIIGLQNSGKSSALTKAFQDCEEPSFFIDADMPVSEWMNVTEFAEVLEKAKEQAKENQRKLTNRVKMEALMEFIQDKHLFLDNIHRATTSKTHYVKELLLKCQKGTITTLDEGQISISLRDIILAEEPEKVNLKSQGKYLPTFDVTPIVFGCLIMAAFLTGNHSAGYILAGLATMSFRMRSAKQT